MVDKKTSDYSAITTANGSDLIDVARAGVNNFKITVDNLIGQIGNTSRITATYVTDNVLRTSFRIFPNTVSRNDADLSIGHTFSLVTDVTVSQLGRFYAAGNTQDHPIGIWEKVSGTLVASGTILAASSSDGNGFKYVSITPVILDATKEYIIAAQEYASGDLWRDSWDSINYFDSYIKRTGQAYKYAATLTKPDVLTSGTTIYNTCVFKYTPVNTPQLTAASDSTNSISLVSRSDGNASLFSSLNDKSLAILNPTIIGGGASLSVGDSFGVIGNSTFYSSGGIKTLTGGATVSDTAYFGAEILSGKSGVAVRSGYLLLEAALSGMLINYDNLASNVSISGFGTAKLSVFTASAAKVGLAIQGAASQTANLTEWQNSAGTALLSISKDGKILSGSDPFNAYNQYAQALYWNGVGATYSSAIFLELDSTSVATSRGLSVYDKRTTPGNQPPIGIVSPDGSAIFGMTWNGGNTIGIFNTFGAQDIAFNPYNTTAMTIKSGGNVGIGETSPGAQLQVNSGAAGTIGTIVKGAVAQTANLTEWQNNSGTVLASISSVGNLVLVNTNISGVKSATFNGEVDDGNSSTADTIDWGAGNNHKSTMTGNCTYTFTAPAGPASLVLKLVQDATGSRTATWPATVKWSGATAPTLTTTANKIDIITFYYDGTSYFGAFIGNYT